MHADRGRGDEHERDRDAHERRERRQVPPGGAGDEQQHAARSPCRPARSRGLAGRSRTSPARAPRSSRARSCRARAGWRERSTTNADSATISSTLPSSEAWKENSGKLIARCAPCAECPRPSTARMLSISAAVDHVFVASQARVVEAREHEHEHEAEHQVDRLAVRRSSADRRARGSRVATLSVSDRADAEPDHGERQQRVERQAQRTRLRDAAPRRVGLIGLSGLKTSSSSRRRTSRACRTTARRSGARSGRPFRRRSRPASTVTAITIGRVASPM